MTPTPTNQVLTELRNVKASVDTLVCCIVGTPNNPDKPGVMERLRLLEEWKRVATKAVTWVGAIVLGAIIIDIVTRWIGWYTRADEFARVIALLMR
jgi:hypothetical protein